MVEDYRASHHCKYLGNCHNAGFTFIEFSIVIAILLLMATVGINLFRDFQYRQLLSSSSEDLRSSLEEARSKSMFGEGGASHGVYIDSANGAFVVFRGSSYETRDPQYDALSTYPAEAISYVGPFQLVFSKIKATTTPAIMKLSNPHQQVNIIEINAAGSIQ